MRHDGFLRDVLVAPARLARLVEAYGRGDRLAPVPRHRRVVFTGMGSSRFAALPAAALLRSRGIDAVAELASTELPTKPAAEMLAVGISASGTTPETVEALERHAGVGTTVALTNAPGSPLAELADHVLPLEAGVEEGGVSCLTFQATLALLQLLAAHLLEDAPPLDALDAAVGAGEALRAGRGDWLPTLADGVDLAPALYLVAPASRLSTALQGALMLREGPRLAADGTETGDWLHVDVYLTKRPGYQALLFTGSRFDAEVLRWANERGSSFTAVGDVLDGAAASIALPTDPLVRLLVETAVPELVAAELWSRRLERGDPDL